MESRGTPLDTPLCTSALSFTNKKKKKKTQRNTTVAAIICFPTRKGVAKFF
jgi:hypothetical protein